MKKREVTDAELLELFKKRQRDVLQARSRRQSAIRRAPGEIRRIVDLKRVFRRKGE